MRASIKKELILMVLILAVLPLGTAYFFLGDVLDTSLSVAFHSSIPDVLSDAQQNLKALRELKPSEASRFHEQFVAIQDLKEVFSNSAFVKENLHRALRMYFLIAFLISVGLALALAFWFSRRAERLYRTAVEEWKREHQRSQYLQEVSLWQEVAKHLAHELKNAATPLEMLSSGLPKIAKTYHSEQLIEKLNQTSALMQEELTQVRRMTETFSRFAKLPAVRMRRACLGTFVETTTAQFSEQRTNVRFDRKGTKDQTVQLKFDSDLLRQALFNLFSNAAEANPAEAVLTISVELSMDDKAHYLRIANPGRAIPDDIRAKIFDPYFSTKSKKENMGLGLAIVKKIIAEHGGEIECLPVSDGAAFLIQLPREKS